MSEQLSKIDGITEEELGKINPGDAEVPEPIELENEEDQGLINLLQQAQSAEKSGDLETANTLLAQYRTEYQNIKESRLPEKISFAEAKEIMGSDFMGPDEIQKAFDVEVTDVPQIPFSKEELEKAKELGQFLILRVDKDQKGTNLTLKRIEEIIQPKWEASGKGKLFRDDRWSLERSEFFDNETPRAGWALTSKEIVEDTRYKELLGQMSGMTDYLEKEVFPNNEVPDDFKKAIAEFKAEEGKLIDLTGPNGNLSEAAEIIGKLKITEIVIPSASEVFYDAITFYENTGKKLLDGYCCTTSTHFFPSHGTFVWISWFGQPDGTTVNSTDLKGLATNGGLLLSRRS